MNSSRNSRPYYNFNGFNCSPTKNFDEIVARCDVMEEEINHVKMKYRQTLRQLHEVKGKYGIEEDQLNEISREKVSEMCSCLTLVDP